MAALHSELNDRARAVRDAFRDPRGVWRTCWTALAKAGLRARAGALGDTTPEAHLLVWLSEEPEPVLALFASHYEHLAQTSELIWGTSAVGAILKERLELDLRDFIASVTHDGDIELCIGDAEAVRAREVRAQEILELMWEIRPPRQANSGEPDVVPRRYWQALVRAQMSERLISLLGEDLLARVFRALSDRYVSWARDGSVPDAMTTQAWLRRRIAWDTGRAVVADEQVREMELGARVAVTNGGSDDDETIDVDPQDRREDIVEIAIGRGLLVRMLEIVETLAPARRNAFLARYENGFDAEETYKTLGLAPASRERGAHNQAFLDGVQRVTQQLTAEGLL
jgi:DNA-directed RNA polymerase specialized sigma24 family protein